MASNTRERVAELINQFIEEAVPITQRAIAGTGVTVKQNQQTLTIPFVTHHQTRTTRRLR